MTAPPAGLDRRRAATVVGAISATLTLTIVLLFATGTIHGRSQKGRVILHFSGPSQVGLGGNETSGQVPTNMPNHISGSNDLRNPASSSDVHTGVSGNGGSSTGHVSGPAAPGGVAGNDAGPGGASMARNSPANKMITPLTSTAMTPSTGVITNGRTNGAPSTANGAPASSYRDFTSVSCPSQTECFAVGNIGDRPKVARSSDGGATWVTNSIPANMAYLGGVSCPTVTVCMAVGNKSPTAGQSVGRYGTPTVITTTDSGSTWREHAVPGAYQVAGAYELAAVYCVSLKTCVAVGDGPEAGPSNAVITAQSKAMAIYTSDGGSSWNPSRLPPATNCPTGTTCETYISAVTCRTQTVCMAVANSYDVTPCDALHPGCSPVPSSPKASIATSEDGGSTWSMRTVPQPYDNGLSSIACTVTACFAVGSGSMEVSSDGGQTWRAAATPARTSLVGVSCVAGTSVCMAVGRRYVGVSTGAVATSDGGASWHAVATPGTNNETFNAVSCVGSVPTCIAVGANSADDVTSDPAIAVPLSP